jgi:hypothetical protein
MSECKVKYCRYKNSHVTCNHLCGKCKQLGHGEVECNNYYLKNQLKKYLNDELPLDLQCSFAGCYTKNLHSIDAHHCTLCNDRYHSKETCSKSINEIKIICPLCKENNSFLSIQQKVYGIEDKCCICLDNNVNVYFPTCGHICICIECCNKINLNKIIINIENEESLKNLYDINKIKSYLIEYPSYIELQIQDNYEYDLLYIRRLNINSDIEGFFVHSNYSSEKNNFINGYAKINRIINENFKI